MHNGSFFKHAAVYGLASLLVQAGGFVLLPIYLRCFSPADYGAFEVVGRLAETVGTCLLFGGFRQAVMSFYQQAEGAAARRCVVCTCLFLYALTALVGGALALLFSPGLAALLAPFLSSDAPAVADGLLRLATLGILLEPFSLIPLTLLQARVESSGYVVVVFAQFLFRVTLTILLVRFLAWGVAGALAATAATGLLFGTVLTARELARGLALPSLTHLVGMVRFALPFLPGGLCFFVLHHGDRFFLLHFSSTAEVGTYALGYKLAMTVAIFSLAPLFMVWSARMYEAAKAPDAPVVFGRMFSRIVGVYALAGLGLCLFADEAVAVLGGPAYSRAGLVVAPVLAGCLCQGAASLMDAGLYVRRRTGLKLGISLSATAVMVGLYAWLIPLWGALGAALATLVGFAVLALLTWAVTQRVFPVRYEWPRLAAGLALFVVLWLAAQALPPAGWAVPVKAALWLLAPLLLWAGGAVRAEEKQFVRESLGRGLARARALVTPAREAGEAVAAGR